MTKPWPQPRASQARILEYAGGRMGVAAVPGSGKTWTLSLLAAKLVRETRLERGQQVLVVTLVNAARGKFEQQVREFLGEESLGTLYRVRTLHGLARDIVAERPGLVGLADDFTIIDEPESMDIVGDALQAWFSARPDFGLEEYVAPDHRDKDYSLRKWREEAQKIAGDFIKRAKDFRVEPVSLRKALAAYPRLLPLAEMCTQVYEAYERGLRYRGAVDFQDLIRLALQALEEDAGFLERLRHRWPVILEDEAQDSSRLQEEILRVLVGQSGNWVRVGDPNQAIYESFTTASPQFLRSFLREPGVVARELPESGRSAPAVIALANRLIGWSADHPHPRVRARQPLAPPEICPLPEGNPPDTPSGISIPIGLKMTGDEERRYIARLLSEWLPEHRDWTVAVLVPTNPAGAEMSRVLREFNLPLIEMLRTTTSTRRVAGTLYRVMNSLAHAAESGALSGAFRVWLRDERDDPAVGEAVARLKKIPRIEEYLAPRDRDWLLEEESRGGLPVAADLLREFREVVRRWQRATLLPVDQLVLTLAGGLFTAPAEIATASSIAGHLRSMVAAAPETGFDDLVAELKAIAESKRKFVGLGEDDDQFDPSRYPGQVVLMTNHGAKGLEWDRVFLMSVNNYDFPSADAHDSYQGESFFARERLNLRAEGLAQLRVLVEGGTYRIGEATAEARVEYASERLRLLYVGITRARRELVITWNTGKRGDLVPARPLHALAAAVGGREWREGGDS